MHDQPAPPFALSVYERLSGRRPWTEVRRLRALQWKTADELEARALARLRGLLGHAGAQVPHYRDLFAAAGLGPGDLRATADLDRFPTTSRAALRAGFPSRVVAPGLTRRGRRSRTSGSTGLPFQFYVDRASDDRVLGSYLFFRAWADAPLGLAVVYLAGPAFGGRSMARSSGLMQAARRLCFGERLVRLIGVRLSPAELRRAIERLAGHDYFILGLPSYTARLATALLAAGLELPAYPRVVISHAETLTEADAAVIGRAFHAPVVNHYTTYELLHLAQSCPDRPELLHLNGDRVVARVIREDGSPAERGEVGRLMLTDLWNEVMPFINYEIGDRAALGGPCPCGRGFPTIASLEGRASELIRTPTGKIISPVTLGRLMLYAGEALPYVWEYQAAQIAPDAVVLRVVPTPRFDADVGRRLRAELERLLGPDMQVGLETVDRIPTEPSGKRLIITRTQHSAHT